MSDLILEQNRKTLLLLDDLSARLHAIETSIVASKPAATTPAATPATPTKTPAATPAPVAQQQPQTQTPQKQQQTPAPTPAPAAQQQAPQTPTQSQPTPAPVQAPTQTATTTTTTTTTTQSQPAAAPAQETPTKPKPAPVPKPAPPTEPLQPTKYLFWEDTYQFTCDAKITAVLEGNPLEPKTPTTPTKGTQPKQEVAIWTVVLDQTVAYPAGGGQPADLGTIVSKEGVTFRIEDVRSQNEIVYHIGQFVTQNKYFNIGDSAVVTLDGERRKQNARCHSGGHLLDVAVINLGLKDLKPGKGHHVAGQAYVEYLGNLPLDFSKDDLKPKLEAEMKKLIAAGSKVKKAIVPYDQIGKACGTKDIPDYLPKGKPARIVTLTGDIGCPCGGTHVHDVNQIGAVKIRKIEIKKGTVRIAYDIA